MREKKVERLFVWFGRFMLFAAIVVNAWCTYKYHYNFINSDDGAELILSHMLAQEGGILSKNWHYSTELEILNTQLVYAMLFRFTDDFLTVRILGQIILTCLFLASYYFCLHSIDDKKAGGRFWKTAFLMLLPISGEWHFLIMKAYYIPFVGISFLSLGFACQMQNENMSRRKRTLVFVLGCVLAFSGCLEGMRHIQLTYIPLVLSSFWTLWNAAEKAGWKWEKFHTPRGLISNSCWLLSAGAGCVVNFLVLSDKYYFRSHDDVKFMETVTFESVQNVWNALLQVMGYRGEQEFLSVGGVCDALAVVSACFLLYYIVRMFICAGRYDSIEQLIVSFVGTSFALGAFIYIMLGTVEPRWVLSCTVPAILLLLFLDKGSGFRQFVIMGGIYGIVFLFGAMGYYELKTDTSNEDKRNVYEFVLTHDYDYGYCTMWVGDWLTEMTNGNFHTRSVRGDYENGKLKIWHWLTPIQVEYREEPILCILEKRRVEDLPIPQEWPVLMEDDAYIIYEIEDHKAVETYFESRTGQF